MKNLVGIFFLFFFLFESKGNSQVSFVFFADDPIELVSSNLVKDSAALDLVVKSQLVKFKLDGFAESKIDSVIVKKDIFYYYFHLGPKYYWNLIESDSKIETILYKSKLDFEPIVNSRTINSSVNTVLNYYENNGYPFAEVYFDSIKIKDSLVSGILMVKENQLITIDSLIIKGKCKTAKKVIEKRIGYKKGMLYSQKFISEISEKIENIPFVSEIRSGEVYFNPGNATLVLYLNDNGNSRFDGLLGLNPDENTGKLSIVGEANIDLLNALRRGERIKLNWEKVKTNSQNFIVQFDYPFLFNTNIGVHTKLNYYRQDTSFANLNALGGFSYFIDNRQEFGVNVQLIQSNSLGTPQIALIIPSVNSVSTLYYGAEYTFNSLDYRINPRKGWLINLNGSTGRKKVIKNQAISLEEYEEIKESTSQFKSEVSFAYFQPLMKKSTLMFRVQSAGLLGDNIFENELYQIGGLQTLRGFNQQSIFATSYSIFTTEYRFIFDKNSAVFAFVDAAFYENNSVNNYQNDFPVGFGAGLNFQTGSGILTLTYGLGKQKNNPILVRNGKVHIGFISLF